MTQFDDSTDGIDGGVFSTDDENQLPVEDTLDDRGVADNLDEGYSPPERSRGVEAFGTTAAEEAQGESIDQRLAQEVPDPAAAFDDPQEESRDDPDQVAEADEFLDDGEVGDARAGRLVAEDEGVRSDTEKDMVGQDVGIDGAGASAEEAAVHVVDEG